MNTKTLFLFNSLFQQILSDYITVSQMQTPTTIPLSIIQEPWTSLPPAPYDFINRHFPVDSQKNRVARINANFNRQKSAVQLTEDIFRVDRDIRVEDCLKIWFQVRENKYLFAQFLKDSGNYNNAIKIHYDNGLVSIKDRSYNFYGSFQTKRDLSDCCIKLGAGYWSPKVVCNNRVKIQNICGGATPNLTFYHKSNYENKQWRGSLMGVYSITRKNLLNYAFSVGYKSDYGRFFITGERQRWYTDIHESFDWRRYENYFKRWTFDYIHRINNLSRVGIEVDLYGSGLIGTYERKFPDQQALMKLKFGMWRDQGPILAMSIENSLGEYGNYSLGLEIQQLGERNRVLTGATINLNL